MDRRNFVRLVSALLAGCVLRPAYALDYVTGHSDISNFKKVYEDAALRMQFLSFLKNVYSIYPPEEFHKMISEIVASERSDEKIYLAIQKRLPELKSILSPVTRELPALRNQKAEMKKQLARLLKGTKAVNGYMEIGTTGRYVHGVDNATDIKGKNTFCTRKGLSFFR